MASPQPASCAHCGKTRKRYPRGRLEGAKRLCQACYHAARRAGTVPGEPMQPVPAVCGDCGGPTGRDAAKGRCGRCYQRWARNGRPGAAPEPVVARVRVLRSGWQGYSPVFGTARLDVAS